jgi:cytochrome c-type biogenesis protein CcmH/NrfG
MSNIVSRFLDVYNNTVPAAVDNPNAEFSPPSDRLLTPIYSPAQLISMSLELIQARPESPEGYLLHGMVSLSNALRLDPNLAQGWQLLSEAFAACGLYDDAAAARQQAVKLDPSL